MYIPSILMARSVTSFSPAAKGYLAAAWPRAAVFDCDGLLVDTARCWQAAYHAAAAAVERSLDGMDLAPLDGASVGGAAEILGGILGCPVPVQLLRSALMETLSTFAPPVMPGVERLLAMLDGRLPLAVASNAPADAVSIALGRTELTKATGALCALQGVYTGWIPGYMLLSGTMPGGPPVT